MQFTKLTAVVTLFAAANAGTVAQRAANPAVYVRNPDYSYSLHPDRTAAMKRDLEATPLHKRSYATVQACYESDCSNCHTVFDGNFQSFQCLAAENTACIIVSNLDNAKVNYWNHDGCNGNESTGGQCGSTENLNAPGTNSIGVQIGCN